MCVSHCVLHSQLRPHCAQWLLNDLLWVEWLWLKSWTRLYHRQADHHSDDDDENKWALQAITTTILKRGQTLWERYQFSIKNLVCGFQRITDRTVGRITPIPLFAQSNEFYAIAQLLFFLSVIEVHEHLAVLLRQDELTVKERNGAQMRQRYCMLWK